jgi:hypothetical protein
MRILCVGTFFMSLGYIIRFTRRNHLNAWSFIFETLVRLFDSTWNEKLKAER